MSETVYQKAQSDDIHLLNHFLKIHQQASASRGDLNYIARRGNTLIGCARLISIGSNNRDERNFWLRGVFVRQQDRRHGIASQLLEFMHHDLLCRQTEEGVSVSTCYAFPLPHLNAFYEALGYEYCEIDALPESLQKRYQQALKTGKNWLCMMKKIV